MGSAIKRVANYAVSDTAYAASWDGVTDVAPSKDSMYHGIESLIGDGIRRNYIINGNFDIWQRGTSGTDNHYIADRWLCSHVQVTKTASRQAFTLGQTDVPDEPTYFMRHAVTTASHADEYCALVQKIEDVRTLAGKTAMFSFYAKADAAKNIAVEIYQDFKAGSPTYYLLPPVKMAITTNWARYTVTIDIPSITGKTLAAGHSLVASIWFSGGSTYNARTDSLGPQSGTFDIAKVALIEGSLDVEPIPRHIGEELALCQRYYEKVYDQEIVPGAASQYAIIEPALTTNIIKGYAFRVSKRVVPIITIISANGVSLKVTTSGGGDVGTNAVAGGIREGGFSYVYDNGSPYTAGTFYYYNWTANAEL